MRECCTTIVAGLRLHRIDLVSSDTSQESGSAVSSGIDNDEVAQSFQKVFNETSGILSGLNHPIDGGKSRRSISCGERIHHLIE
jgi:hypothetical protein